MRSLLPGASPCALVRRVRAPRMQVVAESNTDRNPADCKPRQQAVEKAIQPCRTLEADGDKLLDDLEAINKGIYPYA
jgi:hypothetical protein